MSAETEDLIAHLCNGLAPTDRAAFRQAAENALASAPPCSQGPGSVYRTVVAIWRDYFHAPTMEGTRTTWGSGRKAPSKLLTEPRPGTAALVTAPDAFAW